MRTSRAIVLSVVTTVLALGSLASPVAAANPRLAIVNGIPGTSVDVCLGTAELKSGLRYGRSFVTSVGTGSRTLRFRTASPGKCTGSTLARKRLGLSADDDATIVATARKPMKVVVVDNRLAPLPTGNVNWVAVRHAADLGGAVFTQQVGFVLPVAAPDAFEKGDGWVDTFGTSDLAMLISAYRPSKATAFVGPNEYLTYPGRRLEVILVGTKPGNARFVSIARRTITP